MDSDPVCPGKLDPDPINIRPDPKPWMFALRNKASDRFTYQHSGIQQKGLEDWKSRIMQSHCVHTALHFIYNIYAFNISSKVNNMLFLISTG